MVFSCDMVAIPSTFWSLGRMSSFRNASGDNMTGVFSMDIRMSGTERTNPNLGRKRYESRNAGRAASGSLEQFSSASHRNHPQHTLSTFVRCCSSENDATRRGNCASDLTSFSFARDSVRRCKMRGLVGGNGSGQD